jgi:hypothetical protein
MNNKLFVATGFGLEMTGSVCFFLTGRIELGTLGPSTKFFVFTTFRNGLYEFGACRSMSCMMF